MNGDEVKVRHGDKIITLEEQLARMNKSIRWLQIASVILIVIAIVSVFLTDEQSLQVINAVLGLFGDDMWEPRPRLIPGFIHDVRVWGWRTALFNAWYLIRTMGDDD